MPENINFILNELWRDHPYESTYCSECKKIVVRRYSFDILEWNLDEQNKCKFCGNRIPITGSLDKGYKEKRLEFVILCYASG